MPSPLLAAAARVTAAAAAVQAPVSTVTVYSDRARVQRSGEVQLDGKQTLELPLLEDTVDASTIQLEASGATVLLVQVEHVDEQDFPRGEARELLAQLEKLDDKIAALNGASAARRKQLADLGRIAPAVKLDDPWKPAPKLDAKGWAAALTFIDGQIEELQAAQAESVKQLYELQRERHDLEQRATQLGGLRRRSGHRVRATLSGHGKATLTLTYMVSGARWLPSYDVQFLPEKSVAQISFSGQVSQESG